MSGHIQKSSFIENIRTSLTPGMKARILAYGSSNTERFLPGMHWFDVLELALRDTYGRFHQCVNSGLCGDTSRGLLARFDMEAALYTPRLAIVTIGGNDSNPELGVTPDQFESNLGELHHRFSAIGCAVVFQTYYAPDPARQGDLTSFRHYMEIIRGVARETHSELVDHLARWEAFRQVNYERYLRLMHDGFHVNRLGNMVLGLDVSRHLGAEPSPDASGFWDEALDIQNAMDALSA